MLHSKVILISELYNNDNAVFFEKKFGIFIYLLVEEFHQLGQQLTLTECLRKIPQPIMPHYQSYRSFLTRLESQNIIIISQSGIKGKKFLKPGLDFPFGMVLSIETN